MRRKAYLFYTRITTGSCQHRTLTSDEDFIQSTAWTFYSIFFSAFFVFEKVFGMSFTSEYIHQHFSFSGNEHKSEKFEKQIKLIALWYINLWSLSFDAFRPNCIRTKSKHMPGTPSLNSLCFKTHAMPLNLITYDHFSYVSDCFVMFRSHFTCFSVTTVAIGERPSAKHTLLAHANWTVLRSAATVHGKSISSFIIMVNGICSRRVIATGTAANSGYNSFTHQHISN